MNTDVLIAIGLEALYQDQKRGAFLERGHLLTRAEFMSGGFPVVLSPLAVVLCARAGMNMVKLDPPKAAGADATPTGKIIQLAR